PLGAVALMGFGSVLRNLPAIFRRIAQTVSAVVATEPDVLVIIDTPDFTHRVARRVRTAAPRIPIVDYVSPSVWAWRPWRARAMRRYIDHVLAILPFEPAELARLGGPPCSYVGHPLIERTKLYRPNEGEAARRLANPPLLLVFPGSRRGEIRRLLGIFAQALAMVRRAGAVDIAIPTVPDVVDKVREAAAAWPLSARVIVDEDAKLAAFRSARAALAKSGTVTLELALAGVPTVAAYKVSAIEAMIARRIVQVPSVILANLVLGENVIPEFLHEDCTAEKLAAALIPLMADSPERRRQLQAFARLDELLEIGRANPSARAADIVLQAAEAAQRRRDIGM